MKRLIGIDESGIIRDVRVDASGRIKVVVTGPLLFSSYTEVDAAYTAGSEMIIECDATTAGFSVTLPDATTKAGSTFIINKVDSTSNVVTIVGPIDGDAEQYLSVQYDVIKVRSNGSVWYTW